MRFVLFLQSATVEKSSLRFLQFPTVIHRSTIFQYSITLLSFVSRLNIALHGFGWYRSWRTGLLGVVKWRGVGVYLLGTSVWKGQLFLRRRREGLDQTRHCCSDSLLAFRLKTPPAENHTLRYTTQRDIISICSKFKSNCHFCPLWTQLCKIFNCTSGYILKVLENLQVEYYSISS